MKKEIYLDNSATTKVSSEVAELMMKVMVEDYGNPSSKHTKGLTAHRYVEKACRQLANALKVTDKEWIFTSCGTEADNLAIIGSALANPRNGNHIITTAIEHPAVLESVFYLEKKGYEVTILPVDSNGVISLEDLRAAMRPTTHLVSIMAVNNEVGSVMPIAEAGALIKSINKNTLFHVDAVQGFGKVDIKPAYMNIDMLTISGHKIHAPKGIGALYVKRGIRLQTLMPGGGQQGGIRSGTENVPGIAALGLAAEMTARDMSAKISAMRSLKHRLAEGLLKIDGFRMNIEDLDIGAPHILSVGYEGPKSQAMLNHFAMNGIYVSSGSACSANHPGVSGTLKAIGLNQKYLEHTLRFSLSEYTTEQEIDETVAIIAECYPKIKMFK